MKTRPWLDHYDPGVPHHLGYPAINVPELLEAAALKVPERACTILNDSVLTYSEVNDLSNRLATGLTDLGVKKGERVGLMLPNIPQFILAYFAVLKAGAIVVAINPQYSPREIQNQVQDSGVEILFALANLSQAVKQARLGTKLRRVVLVDPESGLPHRRRVPPQGQNDQPLSPPLGRFGNSTTSDKPRHLYQWERREASDLGVEELWLHDLIAKYPPDVKPQVRISPEDEALFQYSGGTTGVSKAAVALHRNLVANALQFRHWLVGTEDGQETMLLAIPLYHVYGMVVGMLVAVCLGASMVLIPNSRDLDDLLSCIQKHKATLFPGVPNLYNAIIHHPDVKAGKYDLSTIKACISGSAPLMRETKEKFEALTGGKLLEGYGLSEAPTATHCNPMYGENRTGSIGLPLPDVDCRIISLENGLTPLPPGEVGELVISGPQVMKGYHNMPDETALVLRDGWLYTGDIARMDQQGYFYLVDRKKDVIKPGGFQVWPREVEEVIAHLPFTKEVGVAGILDPSRGEVVKAWIVLKPEFLPAKNTSPQQVQAHLAALEEQIRQFCRQELAAYKIPTFFEFRHELPKTNVGKVLRRELVRQHYEGQ